MRRFIGILASFITIVAVSSCTDFQEEKIPFGLSVDVNELSFAETASIHSATVCCGSKWDIANMPSWISLEAITQSGISPYEWTVSFYASANDDYNRGLFKLERAQMRQRYQ